MVFTSYYTSSILASAFLNKACYINNNKHVRFHNHHYHHLHYSSVLALAFFGTFFYAVLVGVRSYLLCILKVLKSQSTESNHRTLGDPPILVHSDFLFENLESCLLSFKQYIVYIRLTVCRLSIFQII